jgi:hypothetical protein
VHRHPNSEKNTQGKEHNFNIHFGKCNGILLDSGCEVAKAPFHVFLFFFLNILIFNIIIVILLFLYYQIA